VKSKRKHHKDTCLKDIGLRLQYQILLYTQ
jgi:hypothetical protein